MSTELEQTTSSVEDQVFDFYRSTDASRRMDDELLLSKAIEEGLTPSSIRYGIMRGVYRGAIRDLTGDDYYFNMNKDNFKLVKADNPTKQFEVDRMYTICTFGVDLVKGNYEEEFEEEEIDKAQGSSGKEPSLPPAVVEEEIDVQAQQSDLITDRHPGGVGESTPDLEYQGRQWHPDDTAGQQSAAEAMNAQKSWDYNELLSGLGQAMQKAQPGAPTSKPHISEREKQFMVQELGRSPQEISTGNVYLTPIQRKLYNQWVNKGLQTSVNSLEAWRRRNG